MALAIPVMDEIGEVMLERTDLWCVCVGSPFYPGEQIVRDILHHVKLFKYLPAGTRNCIGL